ncbi:MAG: DM13 domain-containing protein [Geminicoccaceae bacterium]
MKRHLTIMVAAASLAACASTVDDSPWRSKVATPAMHRTSGQETAVGEFTGKSGRTTTGEVAVFETTAGYAISLGSDFSIDNGTGAMVGLGDATGATVVLAPLASPTGAQIYGVPASVDIGQFRHVYIWDDARGVPLGVAELDLL